ncbi:MAG TPA: histidine kinase dimerization/phospho-acceptor domain-containing protein, partial [Candidatus Limnocylindrales bacterium]|nr:histidine kinase dimerization/phospho-acceptor domain-containing protein [Candidatus Limnocylindrales bacterium]
MDWVVVAFLGLLAIALAVAIGVALDRGRELEAARDAVLGGASANDGSSAPTSEVPILVRRMRERLEASEFELDQQVRNSSYLADLMGVGILRLNERQRVELANPAAHILLRRAAGSIVGRTALETFVDSRVEEVVATAVATGSAQGEFRLAGADGPTLIIRARRSPVAGLWIVLEDVSELRRLQQIRAEFVDNLSHELRTPLSTVSLLAETLAREAEAAGAGVPQRMRDRIGKIEVETGHLVQMVNELLDLARIESGGPLVLLQDVDLGRVAAEAMDRLRLFAERQGLRLVLDVPERTPPVRGDEARLGQVVVNLLHNALKFGNRTEEEGGDGGEVIVAVRPAGDEILLSVQDHGVGISRADQGRIFERFYKVDRVR